MGFFGEWARRIAYWQRREQFDTELQEEMAFHLAQRESDTARLRDARLRFGNQTLLRERSRDEWGWTLLDSAMADIRYTLRGFRKQPAFASIAISTLAVAIGGGTAILTLADAVLFRPLPYPDPAELTLVFEGNMQRELVRADTAPGTYRALRDSMRTLRGLALYQPSETNLTGEGEPERLDAARASANFFQTVGIRPHLGRFFQAGEDIPGRDSVVILSYELWQRRFGADVHVLGRKILLSEQPYTVIGVLPPHFRYYFDRGELWTPFAGGPEVWAGRSARYIYITGRRPNGVSMQQVQAELDALSAQYRNDFPRDCAQTKLQAVSLRERLAEDSRTSLYFLLAAVFGLLLIACSNVASLLLTRAVARGAELSVRLALGASRGRLVRQLFTESLVLAVAAGGASLLVAAAALQMLQPLVPPGMAAFTTLTIDWRVVSIQCGLALFCTLLSGLLPAFRTADSLTTRAIGGVHHERLRGAMIAGEVALAILLLTGASLLFRTFTNLNNVAPGFEPDGLLSMQTVLPNSLYRDPALRTRFYENILERVRGVPGVTGAAFASAVPTTWKGGFSTYTAEGRTQEPGQTSAMMRQTTPGYFKTLGIPLREGRLLAEGDHGGSALVAVVNEAMAKRVWPGESAIGKRIHRGDAQTDNPWITIVGVVGDVREMGLAAPSPVITYFPESQHPTATFSAPNYLLVRTQHGPGAWSDAIRRAVHEVSPSQTVAKILPVPEVLAKETQERRIQMTITVAFASTALFLACLGLYGLISYAVAQRRRELGVRLALGATPSQLVALVVGSGAKFTTAGAVVGFAAAAGLSRFMTSLLFQVKPLDPAVFGAVAGLLASTAVIACWLPARRARKIEPAQALRYD